ncbi:Choline-sulfatase [Planctomycetales bacterium 10988]|nr:Choline-sulfatase [Planctomycetales bacterium 10988]
MIARFPLYLLLFLGSLPGVGKLAAGAERPNVLFIAIDDLNDWIGCLDGHPQALTPNIDRLAERGVLFTNAHCAATACNPSRAAIFSGVLPTKNGVWSNDSKRLLVQHPDMLVLPRAFAESGYRTFGTGKMLHSSSSNKAMFQESFTTEQRWSPLTRAEAKYTPEELPTKGTDHPRHEARLPSGETVVLPLNGMPSDRNPDKRDGESFDWGPMDVEDATMGDTQITDWAIKRLEKSWKKPFFLGVGYYRPHIPLWAPKAYFERFAGEKIILPSVNEDDLNDLSELGKRWAIEPITAGSHATVVKHGEWEAAVAAYLACTTYVDHQIGRLLKTLEDRDLTENTMIVLWTDHGWHLGEKEHWGKWTGWERSTRVPLILVPPQGTKHAFAPGGTRCDAPVSLLDLYPTLTEICQVEPRSGLDGESLLPLLQKPDQSSDRIVVSTFDRGNVSLRSAKFRYLRYADGTEELYDLVGDPHEWTNLLSQDRYEAELQHFRDYLATTALTSE